MAESQKKFRGINGKRLVLIADDELLNREMLSVILSDDYEIIFAENGKEALEQCRKYQETLSLVLLDLMMPEMSGQEVLKKMQSDASLKNIPVIVLTASPESEIESLQLGASDFIPKPYPKPGIILARVLRTIELNEDRNLLNNTERDPLTGLYNLEFFYSYAEQFDQFHDELDTDAIIIDINHFHIINERFGNEYGDQVIKTISSCCLADVEKSGGITCRRSADTFLIYCPHRNDYKTLLDNISETVNADDQSQDDITGNNRIRLRMGVYPSADKNLPIERRFDRAQMASDMVKESFTNNIGFYDEKMHAQELYLEQLLEDFPKAIRNDQFIVYYQGKFDIRPKTPVLVGCEALVRWNHPRLGFISPGTFIPLFEDNGLIHELDKYVWNKVASQIRIWKDQFGCCVPISVNVSRVDTYNPNLVPILQDIILKNGLSYDDLSLEITESAYTEDSEQIIKTAERLRKLGFRIEMDDFGSGYSSLNMLSSLPIDILKLDMKFLRHSLSDKKNIRMLEIVIDMAALLSVPVIAEGVETREQVDILREKGCDMVQGYYFSKPGPAEEFEVLLTQYIDHIKTGVIPDSLQEDSSEEPAPASAEVSGKTDSLPEPAVETAAPAAAVTPDSKEKADSEGEPDKERLSFYEKALLSIDPDETVQTAEDVAKDPKSKKGITISTTSFIFAVIAIVASVILFLTDISVANNFTRMEEAYSSYILAQQTADEMKSGSDYLTDCVRCHVVTGDVKYLHDYFEEALISKSREQALEDLKTFENGEESDAYNSLAASLSYSNELMGIEYIAMRLIVEAYGTDMTDLPHDIADLKLPTEYQNLSNEEKIATAIDLVFNDTYKDYKDHIYENTEACTQALINAAQVELDESSQQMRLSINIMTLFTILFFVFVLVILLYILRQIKRPLQNMVYLMRTGERIHPKGPEELQFVTRTYNAVLNENRSARERLSREASHDSLTGLYNRGAYELMLKSVDRDHIALILVDIDCFKMINDKYGHGVGDLILKKVAGILKRSFRSVDLICRIGGDEFVVIMTRADSTMKDLVLRKMKKANDQLQNPDDELPPASLSVGIAFSDRPNPKGDIFKDADTALYRVKETGRCGCEVF